MLPRAMNPLLTFALVTIWSVPLRPFIYRFKEVGKLVPVIN
jgi:hypothetical protein